MKIAGIIAEYNPFHTGHAYHIQKTRELTGADYIIVVLSGDFVQRGAPALYSKHLRTRMALLGGADLVFELPSTHACESAEFFAQNAVGLLDGLGCVDVLSFGSESGTIEPFLKLGSFLSAETPEYQNLIKKYLKKENPFQKRAVSLSRNYFQTPMPIPEPFCRHRIIFSVWNTVKHSVGRTVRFGRLR